MKGVFYQVDDYVTYNTFDAWQRIVTGARSWHLNLFQSKFDLLRWDREPTQSFDQLISSRIKDLKSRYKRIRLWYSAGRDSHCVLREFLHHGTQIDEIFFVQWSHVESLRNEFAVVTDAIKRIYDHHCLLLPKITLFSPGPADYLRYWKVVSSNSHSGGIGSNMSYNLNSFSAILDCFDHLQDDDTCNLFGLEKPKLQVEGCNVFYQITDLSVHHAMSPNHNIEWFFLNDHVPELVIKQCHMLLRHARSLAVTQFSNDLGAALYNLQNHRNYYDQYCLCIGLGASISPVTGSGGNKNFGLSNPVYDSLHLVSDNDRWDSKDCYRRFTHNATDLINSYGKQAGHSQDIKKFVGILSQRHKIDETLSKSN